MRTVIEMHITIYTDGACDIHAENQPGGWAAILCATDDSGSVIKESVVRGGREMTTNNQMELTAVIEGLNALKRPSKVTIVTDSLYVIDVARGSYKAKKNQRLWHDFFKLAEKHEIEWEHVAGHSGHEYNDRCDEFAVAEKRKVARQKSDSRAIQSAFAYDTPYKIYLSTQYSGKVKTTAWSAVALHDDKTTELSDALVKASELEAILIAAIETLKALPTLEAATIFTAQEYLAKGMNEWIDGWIRRNWKRKGDKPVKYKEHWLALRNLAGQRHVQFKFVKSRQDNPHFQRATDLAKRLLERAD